MNSIELHSAFLWTCDNCGRDHVERVPWRPLDPANPEDRAQIVGYVESDLQDLWDDAGNGEPVFSAESRKKLDDVMIAATGGSVERYRARYLPLSVVCKHCGFEAQTEFGERVMQDIVRDDLDEDDEDDGDW